MAITWQTPGAIAYSSSGGTSVAPAYPASSAQGEKLILIVGQKPSAANGGTVTTPADWNLVTSITGAGGYGTTLGADTGNTNLFVYERTVPVGGLSGTLSVTVGTNGICWAFMSRLTNSSNYVWDSVAAATGSQTAGGNVSITFGTNPGVTANDYIIGAMCIPTDVQTPTQFSAQAFTHTSVTFGTVTEINEPDSNAGDDIGGFSCRAAVSSGTGSGNPSMTATAAAVNTNVRGPAVFIRIREKNNLITLTGNNCNNPNTTSTGAFTQQHNISGNSCKNPNTTTTGAITQTSVRYWVGGSGTWNGSDTTHWSTSDGGGGGASVPTSTTDVYFNANSNVGTGSFSVDVTTTVSCKDFTISGLDGALTFTNSSGHINCYGNWSSPATGVTFSQDSIDFVGTGTQNFNTNGGTIASKINFSGTGTRVAQSATVCTNQVDLSFGTLDHSAYNLTCQKFLSEYNNTRHIHLPPVLTITGNEFYLSGTNLDLDHNSGRVDMQSGTPRVRIQNYTIYDLEFSYAAGFNAEINNASWDGNFTCHNWTWKQANTSSTINTITFGYPDGPAYTTRPNVTVIGTLTMTPYGSADVRYRTRFVCAASENTAETTTLTLNATSGLANCDWGGIVVTGTAAPISGTSFGNLAGNSGITFTAAKTVYVVGTGVVYWNASTPPFATTPGGGAAVANYPLGQDTVIVDASSGTTGLAFNGCVGYQSFDSSAKSTYALDFNQGFQGGSGGYIKFGANNTFDSARTLYIRGGGTIELTGPSSAAITCPVQITSFDTSQEVKLVSNLTHSGSLAFELAKNKLNLNGYTLTSSKFTARTGYGGTTKTLAFGTGKLLMNGSGNTCSINNNSSSLTLTYSAGASIEFANAAEQVLQSAQNVSFPTLRLAGAGGVRIESANTFYDVVNSVQPTSLTLPEGVTTTFSNFSLRGTAGNLIVVKSNSTSTKATLSKSSGVVSCDYLNINDNAAGGGATWYAGSHSTDGLDNTGWIFNSLVEITGNNVNQPNTTTTGAIETSKTITGNNVNQPNTSSTGGISQTHVITGASVNQNNQTTTGAIIQTQVLIGNNVNQPNNTTTGRISREQTIAGNNVNQPNTTTTGAISQTHVLSGNSVNQPNTTTTGQVSRVQTITGNNVNQPNTTTSAQIAQVHTLTGNNVNQSNRTTTGAISQTLALTGNSVNQNNQTTTGAITQTQVITGTSVNQPNTTTTGAISQAHVLAGSNVQQANQSTTGAIWRALTLTGNSVNQINQTTTGAISQTHVLTGANCQQQNYSNTGQISLFEDLLGNNVQQINLSTSGAITQIQDLSGNNVLQPNSSSTGAIWKTLTLTGNSVNQPNQSGTGAINQAHVIAGNSVNQTNQSTTGTISQAQGLTGNSVNQTNQSSTAAVTQTHVLTANNVNQPNRTSTGSIGGIIDLTGSSVNQPNQTSTGAINQVLTLTGNSANQNNQTSTGAVTQIHVLLGNSVWQTNQTTAGSISQTHVLTGNHVLQVNQSSTGSIALVGTLTGNNVVQPNTSSTGAVQLELTIAGNNVRQFNQTTTGFIEQLHVLQGLNANQFNRSSTGFVVVEGRLIGDNCQQVNLSSTGRINAYPVENAPNGSTFKRYRFTPSRPKVIVPNRPSNTNVIGPL